MSEESIRQYRFVLPIRRLASNALKALVWSRVTKKSLPLFVRASDRITTRQAQIQGVYEPPVKQLIEESASRGFGGFLIDIGAHIGLISCQSGDCFKKVFMFEPNPDCCAVLKVNAKMALSQCQFTIYPFGLGDGRRDTILNVPKSNWGGAFVRESNSYEETLLAQKDAFTKLEDKNYHMVAIHLETADWALQQVFDELRIAGLKSGVIKIDVEGYEPIVLAAIAGVIPADFRTIVIFENWSKNFDVEALLQKFSGRAELFKMQRSPRANGGTVRQAMHLLLHGGYQIRLEPAQHRDCDGTLVMLIHEQRR